MAINYIIDGEDFSTVDASISTLLAVTLPQGAMDYYDPIMVSGSWYRYYYSGSVSVYNANRDLRIFTDASNPQTGILQRLSGLTIGNIYSIRINQNVSLNLGKAFVNIYSGRDLQSTHIITSAASQKIEFTANSTEDTILIDSKYGTVMNRLELSSISVIDVTPTIQFAPGLNSKPLAVSGFGAVKFTTGRDSTGAIIEITPNQTQCEAYGYTYNQSTGTCSAYTFNSNVQGVINNENNRTFGVGNISGVGTNNTLVMGESNTIRGNSRNSLVTGKSNQIAEDVNNVSMSGTSGEATASNSVVLGGNSFTAPLGMKQSIHLMYGRQTTTSGWVASYLNDTTASYFNIPDNTVMYFHAEVLGVRVGGTGTGNPGDFASFVERGVIINKSGVTSISRERDAIKSSGTVTTWLTRSSVSAANTNFILEVKGAANVTIEWASTIRFTQIKTGVTL